MNSDPNMFRKSELKVPVTVTEDSATFELVILVVAGKYNLKTSLTLSYDELVNACALINIKREESSPFSPEVTSG